MMADFIFNIGKQELTELIKSNRVWKATSGMPGRHKPIAPGNSFEVPKGSLMAGEEGHGVPCDRKYAIPPFSYRDQMGFSWFLWLGQGNLGIHPDGNVPGTLGCIGVTENDTKELFELIREINRSRKINVKVEP
jgi:hypothetical protein